jgi:hypothetical protein
MAAKKVLRRDCRPDCPLLALPEWRRNAAKPDEAAGKHWETEDGSDLRPQLGSGMVQKLLAKVEKPSGGARNRKERISTEGAAAPAGRRTRFIG